MKCDHISGTCIQILLTDEIVADLNHSTMRKMINILMRENL